jgi:hypothetical protein
MEANMSRSMLCAAAVAVSAAMMFALPGMAFAQQQKKVSFQQAYNLCKAEIDKTYGAATDQNTAQRMSAGEACMKRRGHTLFGR